MFTAVRFACDITQGLRKSVFSIFLIKYDFHLPLNIDVTIIGINYRQLNKMNRKKMEESNGYNNLDNLNHISNFSACFAACAYDIGVTCNVRG